MPTIADFKAAFSSLGANDPSVLAIFLVGSYARNRQRPNSDIDIVIVTGNKEAMLASIDWLAAIGPIDGGPGAIAVERYGEITSLRFF
jgi:hypothetical protein